MTQRYSVRTCNPKQRAELEMIGSLQGAERRQYLEANLDRLMPRYNPQKKVEQRLARGFLNPKVKVGKRLA